MGKTIPYFYADLIARMVSGAVLISLIGITALHMPKPWVDFICNLDSAAQAVMIPILFAGLAYVLGTVLEALLNSILDKIYIHAFGSASKKYSPLYQKPNDVQMENIRSAKDLSRASFGHLIVSPSDHEKQAIPHIVRFHSEAKMGFSSAIILCAFLVLTIADKYTTYQLIRRDIENASLWLFIIGFTILALVATTYQRLQSRAWFVIRTIERSAAEENSSKASKELRNELLVFCHSKKTKGTSNQANSADRSRSN